MTAPDAKAGQRIDRWLWFARIFKSRSLATKTTEEHADRVTRAGATIRTDKPSYALKIGDVLTLKVRGVVRVLEVLDGGLRRGPPSEARTLYRDLSAPEPGGELESAPAPHPAAKPGKRDRRALDRLRSDEQLGEE
jgi:ribosome-associated heat shock protein Hsp15